MWVGSSPPDRHHLQDSMSLTDSQFSRIHEKLTSNVGAISLQRFLDGEPKYNSPQLQAVNRAISRVQYESSDSEPVRRLVDLLREKGLTGDLQWFSATLESSKNDIKHGSVLHARISGASCVFSSTMATTQDECAHQLLAEGGLTSTAFTANYPIPATFSASVPLNAAQYLEDAGIASDDTSVWLNHLLQQSSNRMRDQKREEIKIDTWWIKDGLLHGAMLRVNSQQKSRTYLVPPVFSKRQAAKMCVCSQARYSGIEDFLRQVVESGDAEMTTTANQLPSKRMFSGDSPVDKVKKKKKKSRKSAPVDPDVAEDTPMVLDY